MATEPEAQPQSDSSEVRLTLVEHLGELRDRLIKAVVAVVAGMLVGLAFTRPFLQILLAPMGENQPVALRPTETIVVYFKLALILGLVIAMPVVIYQFVRFVVPGLTSSEKRYLYILLPFATLSFAAGVGFAAFVMLPFSIRYLKGFLSDIVRPTYSIEEYISFVTTLLFGVGVVFETPLVIAFLARIGVITPAFLSRYRRHAILLVAVVAAVITPTPDPFNMMLVMAPLYGLYELGVVLAKLVGRTRTEG